MVADTVMYERARLASVQWAALVDAELGFEEVNIDTYAVGFRFTACANVIIAILAEPDFF